MANISRDNWDLPQTQTHAGFTLPRRDEPKPEAEGVTVQARLCLITGASSGIGEALARLYASRGYDLALVARRGERLHTLAKELHEKHNRIVYALKIDLADPRAPDAIIKGLEQKGRHVDILINNAGYGLPGGYAGTNWTDQARFIQVMVSASCDLTHKLLLGMRARGYGRIINIASLAGQAPASAGHTLYAAAKAFMIKFTEALADECAGTGVHVSAICPGFTKTEFHDAAGTRDIVDARLPWFMWMSAEKVAELTYRASEQNKTILTPGIVNKAIAALVKILPDDWARALASGTKGMARN